jgi:cyclopropane-fatty-acyl-phospholipid synthase
MIALAESGMIPDRLIRWGIRRQDKDRLRTEDSGNGEAQRQALERLIQRMRESPIAVRTDKPKEQHYEVSPDFFHKVLGRRMKYSGCYWPPGVKSLDEAEEAMLALTCDRAQVQEAYITGQCAARGLRNVEMVRADMNKFETERRFDRVISVEMFEHMRNWEFLLQRIATWLRSNGKLFIHIFTHRQFAYVFEEEGKDNWMGRYFFTEGLMPSDDLLYHFQDHLAVEAHWRVDGTHYQKTAEAWLANMDRQKRDILPIFKEVYREKDAARWFQRWRIFFMACAELWGYRKGREWLVSHYLFRKPKKASG